jgi:type VI secretion system protein ImpK
MSPDFAAAVDPVFKYVLSVMEGIETGKALPGQDVRLTATKHIDQAEVQLGDRADWKLAKYALTAWVDEVLIDSPWEGRTWWEQHRLEFQYFRTADAFTVFYEQAKKAAALPRKDALETYYVCVVLGFRGVYGDPNGIQHAEEAELPSSLEEWARQVSMSIELEQDRPPLLQQGQPGPGAPPLDGKYLLIGSVLFFVVLLALTAVTAWFVFVR